MLLIVSGAVPVLVSVAVRAALVVPTFWLPKLSEVGLSVTLGADVTPVPVSGTLCGLPPALSLMLRVAERAPFADGVKVTLMMQLAVAARVLGLSGQVEVSAKSAAFAPFTVMPLIVSAAAPLFVRVIVCAELVAPIFWLPKLSEVGLSVTAGAETTPVPLRGTLCGLPAALSLILTLALRAPEADGEKVTPIVQLAPAASVLGDSGQVVVSAKSAAFVPVRLTLLIVNAAVPELVSVTV
jgi:hypothetical protein